MFYDTIISVLLFMFLLHVVSIFAFIMFPSLVVLHTMLHHISRFHIAMAMSKRTISGPTEKLFGPQAGASAASRASQEIPIGE